MAESNYVPLGSEGKWTVGQYKPLYEFGPIEGTLYITKESVTIKDKSNNILGNWFVGNVAYVINEKAKTQTPGNAYLKEIQDVV